MIPLFTTDIMMQIIKLLTICGDHGGDRDALEDDPQKRGHF